MTATIAVNKTSPSSLGTMSSPIPVVTSTAQNSDWRYCETNGLSAYDGCWTHRSGFKPRGAYSSKMSSSPRSAILLERTFKSSEHESYQIQSFTKHSVWLGSVNGCGRVSQRSSCFPRNAPPSAPYFPGSVIVSFVHLQYSVPP